MSILYIYGAVIQHVSCFSFLSFSFFVVGHVKETLAEENQDK